MRETTLIIEAQVGYKGRYWVEQTRENIDGSISSSAGWLPVATIEKLIAESDFVYDKRRISAETWDLVRRSGF